MAQGRITLVGVNMRANTEPRVAVHLVLPVPSNWKIVHLNMLANMV